MGIMWNDLFVVSIRMLAATVIGGIIGLERRRMGKFIGAKTNSVMCLAACSLICMISRVLPTELARVTSGIFSGMGFMGAGIFLASNTEQIVGFTSVSILWFVVCIGIMLGTPYWYFVVPMLICYFIIAEIFPKIEHQNS